MAGSHSSAGFFRTLCWAVYLGCSWTWCIGMFLPVILVSEFGNIAWFVFAIPNVIGAAAMGWTLAKPGASERIVAEHRDACVAFSAVTLAFHLFFLFWMSWIHIMPMEYSITAVVTGLSFGWIGRKRVGLDFLLAFAVLAVSLLVFAKGMLHPVFGVQNPVEAHRAGSAMLGLGPICVFGFLLCPYLDLTFHRARQQTPPVAGMIAFGVGYGVVFLLMIILTLMYVGDFANDHQPFGSFGPRLLVVLVMLHVAAQAGFTLAAHLRALPTARSVDAIIWGIGIVLAGVGIFAVRQQRWFNVHGLSIQMYTGDLVYRLFMSFYGLVFPAYVWICMVPIRGKSPGPTRAALIITAIAVLISAPMFWVGFVNEKMLWLIPGVMVLMLARLFVPSRFLT